MWTMSGQHRLIAPCVLACFIAPGILTLTPEYQPAGNQQHARRSPIKQQTSQVLYTIPGQPSSHREGRSHSVYGDDTEGGDGRPRQCGIERSVVDCSSRGLHHVPDDLPAEITSLDLSNNSITSLPDLVFLRYPLLQHLNISSNYIDSLGNLSFHNLSSLVSLDLHNNSLEMRPGVYPNDVFAPLTSLLHLNISRNNKNVSKPELRYPDVALSRLTSLRELGMDGLNVDIALPMGPGFQKMELLTNLTLAGYNLGNCQMNGLKNDTFQNVRFLEHLNIADCSIQGNKIHKQTFSELTRLRSLDLSHNEDIDFPNLDRLFYGLKNATNLTHLHMHLISNRYSLSVCLDSKDIKNFPPNLAYFDARENNLEAVSNNVIDKLTSVEQLNLSGNRFVFGAYLLDLPKLRKLKTLKLSGEYSLYRVPELYPYFLNHERMNYPSNSSCTIYTESPSQFILKLPPHLEYLEMDNAGLKYILSKMNISADNTLRNLSLSGNKFPQLIGPIYGLHALEYLDLSFNVVRVISDVFFQNLTTLKVLILNSNVLGPAFSGKQPFRAFASLTRLQVLDLSFNFIDSITSDVFLDLGNLTTLLLDRNPLMVFEVDITHMNLLQMLNLSETHISSLPVMTQQHITKLIAKSLNVTVDLSKSQINCDCINLNFLTWMTSCGAFRIEPGKYFCSFQDLTGKIITDGYAGIISSLSRTCISATLLVLISGSCSVLVIVFLIGGIIFRFRWNIRYMYYAAYLRYKHKSKIRENHFQFDAFVCYAEEDMDFVEKTMDTELSKRGLKTLLHRRDFTAGQPITSNIVGAVSSSKKTVVVLTRSLMESHWCGYEIEMAKMEGVYSGRQVLVFVIMEEIPREKLGRDLLYNIKNNTYLELPSPPYDTDKMQVWWDKLANDIKE
ncbi:hypothetical protein BsWGS_22992 [Bradybaena similaris]